MSRILVTNDTATIQAAVSNTQVLNVTFSRPASDLHDSQVVRPWLGSAAGLLINSAYVYQVYEQTGRIPIATAQQATQQTVAEGMVGTSSPLGAFYLSSLFQKLNSYYDRELKFASIMEMYPDPYGSSRLTDFFVSSDQCPQFYSQLPPIPYTLLAVDATSIVSDNDNAVDTNLTVHWLVANIFNSDFTTGSELVSYTPPTPADANKHVTLMFIVFAQSTPVDPSALGQLCPDAPSMCQLNVTDLISTWNLGDIVGVNWLTAMEDGFSIKVRCLPVNVVTGIGSVGIGTYDRLR
ncbi:hypothetical protein ElyMa_003309100 [Elysia marginata]|uniref:Uncharacterized protein n=1 Tax=Elysia marginata TaxID=1093978 RepID=A0AAV4JD45_9GAST|nr:hypothetical protein ElyMa_003309100 [Elysia marginata]